MKRVQLFSMRDMPDALIDPFKRLFEDSLGHIVEFYPSIDDDIRADYEPWQRRAFDGLVAWLKSEGLDESDDPYRYVLITYQPE